MFEFPSRSELSELRDEEFSQWFRPCRDIDVAVVGCNPAGLTAGINLVDRGKDVVILEESEQLGDRLLWETGPVPIVSPADELLDDLGFRIEENPPIWVDRVEIFNFLLHRFLSSGGRVIHSVYLETVSPTEDRFELEVSIGEHREVMIVDELGLCDSRSRQAPPDPDEDDPMERMVRATERTSEGWVRGGYQCLSEEVRDRDFPYVNGECLSGRKMAELILSGE
jgi:hypothetical protein